ncbi:MAG: acyl carrier protein, partial [Alphaproteobacteria bacterium]
MKTRFSIFPGAIVETVTRYIGREVSLTDDFSDDVGLDSIDRLNLMTAIEQAHDIELSDEEIASVSTLQDLLSLLKTNSGNAGDQERKAEKSANPATPGS